MEHTSRKHTRSPQKVRRDKILYIFAKILIVISALIMIPYLVIEFIPFIRAVYEYKKVNVTTMCYTFLRLMLVLVPFIFALPEKLYLRRFHLKKIEILNKWFMVLGATYILSMAVDIMTYNVFSEYVENRENPDPILIKMLWGSINIIGLIFCFFQGLGYLFMWRNIKSHKKSVVILLSVIYALYMLPPVAMCFLLGESFSDAAWQTWFYKNIWFFISNIFLLFGLIVAAQSRKVWSDNVWQ